MSHFPKSPLPIILWTAVITVAAFYLLNRYRSPDTESGSGTTLEVTEFDGVQPVDIPWNHLPDVDRFVLTDQEGKKFDSREVTGKPMLVSFFFATCPTFCRSLNNELDRLNQALRDVDVQFVTITVNPENDTVDVLREYAAGYDAKPDRWAFLTGPKPDLVAVGEHMFNVPIDPGTHTDNVLLVDQWGRFRDRFKWDDPSDTKRLLQVVKQVAQETAPPLDRIVSTRNVMAGVNNPNLNAIPWLRDFYLWSPEGDEFFSRQMTGQVWLAHFAGTESETVGLVEAWESLNGVEGLPMKVIASDDLLKQLINSPTVADDRAGRLSLLSAPDENLRRIARECFGHSFGQVGGTDQEHGSTVWVIGRWGEVRGQFRLSEPAERDSLVKLVQQLREETQPPATTFGYDHPSSPNE